MRISFDEKNVEYRAKCCRKSGTGIGGLIIYGDVPDVYIKCIVFGERIRTPGQGFLVSGGFKT